MNKSNKYMKISIITITYNSAKTLPRALESVRSQTYGDIEHIIVDGASTDGTVELIKAYANPPSLERVKSSARSDCRWPSVELPGEGLSRSTPPSVPLTNLPNTISNGSLSRRWLWRATK